MNHIEYNLLTALDAVCEQKNDCNKFQSDSKEYSLAELKEMIENLEIKATVKSNKLTIVNAGVMNAGKSSVFNALLGVKDCLKVDDIRTTVENREVKFKDDIYLVDTPGLEANNQDTQIAYDGYKDASVIVFVHSLNVGELHKSELNAINKIKGCFPDKESFLERLVLVGTRKDMECEVGQNNIILEKIRKDLKEYCGIEDFEYALVSVPFYWDGVEYNDKDVIEESDILLLKSIILKRLEQVRASTELLAKKRFENEKNYIVNNLEKHKKIKVEKIRAIENKYYAQLKDFLKIVTVVMRNLKAISKRC